MSNWRPHNPLIDTLVIAAVIGAGFVILPMVWWVAEYIAQHAEWWPALPLIVLMAVWAWAVRP